MIKKIKLLAALIFGILFSSCAVAHGQNSLKDLYNKVNPSVGVLLTVERTPSPEKPGELMSYSSLGSGVLISKDGDMITAAHVVQAADSVFVQFLGGEKVIARVIASEPSADLALLKLSKVPESAVPVSLGESDGASIGDQVFIIGAPYGIEHVLTVGYISARHKPNVVVKNFEIGEFFQTDAAINQGNSGGPMFNMKGEVIGIVSSIFTKSGGFEGIGFAVTSNTARKVLLDAPTPWSGVDAIMLTGDLARAFNLPQPDGMLVQRVAINSIAYRAKVQGGTIQAEIDGEVIIIGGDIILSVQGIPISADLETLGKIKEAVRAIPIGGEIKLTVLRGGEIVELSTIRTY